MHSKVVKRQYYIKKAKILSLALLKQVGCSEVHLPGASLAILLGWKTPNFVLVKFLFSGRESGLLQEGPAIQYMVFQSEPHHHGQGRNTVSCLVQYLHPKNDFFFFLSFQTFISLSKYNIKYKNTKEK